MKTRPVRPMAEEIQKRFFQALDVLIKQGKIKGVSEFANKYGLHKAKYSEIRKVINDPDKTTKFKFIDIDAPAYLIRDYGVFGDWLMAGQFKMFVEVLDRNKLQDITNGIVNKVLKNK